MTPLLPKVNDQLNTSHSVRSVFHLGSLASLHRNANSPSFLFVLEQDFECSPTAGGSRSAADWDEHAAKAEPEREV